MGEEREGDISGDRFDTVVSIVTVGKILAAGSHFNGANRINSVLVHVFSTDKL